MTKCLRLSGGTAYSLIRVARKSVEIPEMQKAIAQGELSLSHAKTISSVITHDNKTQWLNKAKESSVRELEKEIAELNPKTAIPEKMRSIGEDTIKIQCAVDEKTAKTLNRVKDLLSQKLGKAVKLEEALGVLYGPTGTSNLGKIRPDSLMSETRF